MAKQYAKVLGIIFLLLGFMGFIPGLTPGGLLLGIFMVDPFHNMVHLLSGLLLVSVGFSGTEAAARNAALIFGLVYGLVTIIGFTNQGSILGLFMVNMPDNFLHLVISVTAIAVGLSRERRVPIP